ncbi:hypothetical protein D3C78_1000200 [compost metagenome]
MGNVIVDAWRRKTQCIALIAQGDPVGRIGQYLDVRCNLQVARGIVADQTIKLRAYNTLTQQSAGNQFVRNGIIQEVANSRMLVPQRRVAPGVDASLLRGTTSRPNGIFRQHRDRPPGVPHHVTTYLIG